MINKILSKNNIPWLISIVALVVAGSFYFQLSKLKQDPNTLLQEEVAVLVEKIGKLIVLPADEEPTVATVSDPELLKDQAFFNNAQEGDKVLIYTNAKKAVLYSVLLNKIINVAPLNIGDTRGVETSEVEQQSQEALEQ